MKIVLHFAPGPQFAALLSSYESEGFSVAVVPPGDMDTLRRQMADAEVLFHVLEPVTEAVMGLAPGLKLIQKIGVGVDTIDRRAALKRSIKVANMPGTNSQAVAEMTLLLMLGALRRVTQFDRAVRAGLGWKLDPGDFDGLGEIKGRTVGFLGYGQIPRRLTPVLKALGADVIYFDLSPDPDFRNGLCTRDAVMEKSDIISLHLPLAEATRNIVNRDSISRMRRGAVLVNTARGGLIDEAALLEALRSGHLAAAGLDTFSQEPLPSDHPYLSLSNVVLLPHIAWLTGETLQRSMDVAFDNCRAVAAGHPLRFEVLPP